MRMETVIGALSAIAPPGLAGSWDNVGLIAGEGEGELRGPVLLTIDLTEAVAEEAASAGAGLVVAYHPPIFRETRRLTDGTREGRAVLRVLRSGGSVYSPHTALDAAAGGVADWLLDRAAGDLERLGTRRAIAAHRGVDAAQTHKVVVFVPVADADRVAAAMSEAGAGRIGDYSRCSYRLAGEGTFLGGDSTNPAVGERGVLERVEEVRLEMVCGTGCLGEAIAALSSAHPYEEPAFDVYALAERPEPGLGAGRVCDLKAPTPAADLAAYLAAELGVERVRLGAEDGAMIDRIAVCPGAGAGLLRESGLLSRGEGLLFVTGEMSHHEVLAARSAGCGVALAGHTRTERGYLPVLRDRLADAVGGFDVRVSGVDGWPLREIGAG